MQKPHADIALRSCPAVSSIREGVKQCSRHLRAGPGTDQYCLHRAWRRSSPCRQQDPWRLQFLNR